MNEADRGDEPRDGVRWGDSIHGDSGRHEQDRGSATSRGVSGQSLARQETHRHETLRPPRHRDGALPASRGRPRPAGRAEARGGPAQGASRSTESALVSDVPCPDPFAFHDGVNWYIFGTGAEHFFLQGKALVPREMRKVALHLDHSQFPLTRRPHLGIHRLPAPRRVVSRLRDAASRPFPHRHRALRPPVRRGLVAGQADHPLEA